MRKLILVAATGAAALVASASSSSAAVAYGLTDGNRLVSFDTTSPNVLTSAFALRDAGNNAIQDLVGIDIRPATNTLYGLGAFGQLYTINTTNGVATPVAALNVALSGSRFGVDFNPVADRLRVVSDTDQNLRVDVSTGATTVDGTINPASANITSAAYTNSFSGAATTSLYVIDTVTDQLMVQNPPNNGTVANVGALGVDVSSINGFDILNTGGATGTNTGYAALQLGANGVSQLYSINLTTGAATLVGTIGGGDFIDGLAIAQVPEPTTLGLVGGAIALGLRRRSR